MVKQVFRIYLMPFAIVIGGLSLWYFAGKYILHIDFDQFLSSYLGYGSPAVAFFKFFFAFCVILFCLLWVFINKKSAKKGDEGILEKYFEGYGKSMMFFLSIVLLFVLFIAVFIIS